MTTQRIRVVITGSTDNWSRLAEVEALTVGSAPSAPAPAPSARTNVAAAPAGATIKVSSFYSSDYSPATIIDGNRAGPAFWNDATFQNFPDSVEVDFARTYTVAQVNLFSVQDDWKNPSQPASTQTFAYYGVKAFSVEYWTGSAWAPIQGATVTNNTLVWRTVSFSPVTTDRIRVVITDTADGFSRLTELEVLTGDN